MHTKATISSLNYFESQGYSVDMLRLDLVHPIVSGNKWYKLKEYLLLAKEQKADTLASFGGPYSNHIVALAYAGHYLGLKTIGYIRTNADEPITPSLQEAIGYGMQLIYLGRTHFQEKKNGTIYPITEILITNIKDPSGKLVWREKNDKGSQFELKTFVPSYNYAHNVEFYRGYLSRSTKQAEVLY